MRGSTCSAKYAASCTIPQITSRRPTRRGDVDRVGDALVGVDAAEDHEVVARARRASACRTRSCRCRGAPSPGSRGRASGRRPRSTRRPNAHARRRAGCAAPEKPWIVVTIGAPHWASKASGSQSSWLCTRSKSGGELDRVRDVQRLPHPAVHAGVLGIAVRRDRLERRRRHRIGRREEGDVDAPAHQPLGEQARHALPRTVVPRRRAPRDRPEHRHPHRAGRPRRAPAPLSTVTLRDYAPARSWSQVRQWSGSPLDPPRGCAGTDRRRAQTYEYE